MSIALLASLEKITYIETAILRLKCFNNGKLLGKHIFRDCKKTKQNKCNIRC